MEYNTLQNRIILIEVRYSYDYPLNKLTQQNMLSNSCWYTLRYSMYTKEKS
jgi:hypothetical protein